MAKKPSMGRQKIKIEKIEVKNHLQVTFSKRRSGLFKKASELCTLCGVEIAIVVFSPAGKVFSFGHPSVDAVVDRFLARGPVSSGDPFHLVEAQRSATARELNLQLGQILGELEAERKRSERLDGARRDSQSQCWWEAPVEKLGAGELEQLREAMEELKRSVDQAAAARMVNVGVNGVYVGNGVFEQYESKPGVVGGNSNGGAAGFGYCHGFF